MELFELISYKSIKWLTKKPTPNIEVSHVDYLSKDVTMTDFQSHQLLLVDNKALFEKAIGNENFDEKIKNIDQLVIGLTDNLAKKSYELLESNNISVFQFKEPVDLNNVIIKLTNMLQFEEEQAVSIVLKDTSELAKSVASNASQKQIIGVAGRLTAHSIILLNSHFEVIASTPEIANSTQSITQDLRNNSQIDYTLLSNSVQCKYEEHIINIYPLIVPENNEKYFLGIFDFDENKKYQDVILQQILTMVSVVNSKVNLKIVNALEQKNKIYSSIIKEELTSEQISNQLQSLNISQTDTYQLGLFEIPITNLRTKSKILKQAYELIKWFTEEYHASSVLIKHEHRILIVLPSTQNISHLLIALKKFLDQNLLQYEVFYFGYSKTPVVFSNLNKVYREALEAARLGITKNQRVIQYRPKHDKEVLKLIPEWEIQSYLNEVFSNIKTQNDVDDLILTLNVYFTHGQSIAKVSETMFIHRNTVIFRLKKIESLLKINLKDAADVEKLFLGTMLWNLTSNKS